MGVVIRQGLKSTIVTYVGVLVGIVSYLFVYTRALELYGMIQWLITAAATIAPLAMLGSYALAVRYYAPFRDPDASERGLLTLVLGVTSAGLLVLFGIWPLADDWLIESVLSGASAAAEPYVRWLPLLVLFIAYARILAQYTSNFRRIVVPAILEQFSIKITLPILIWLAVAGLLPEAGVVYGTLVHYGLILLGMVAYIWALGQLRLRKVDASLWALRKEMAGYAGYGIAGVLSASLAFRIDVLMVGAYLDFAAVGQYSLAMFVSEVISKPYGNLRSVMSPLVNEAWARRRKLIEPRPDEAATGVEDSREDELQGLYRKSSDNMLLICGYIFSGIVVCFPALVEVASNGEVLAGAFAVVLLLGLGRVFDAATSINEQIISYSPKYWFNLLSLIVLAGFNIIFNVWLIPRYGITGAAAATLLSMTLFNLACIAFSSSQFGLWPFGKTTYEIAAILSLVTVGVYVLPPSGWWWLDIAYRGGLVTVLLAGYTWWRPPSDELKGLMRAGLARLGVGV